MKIKLTRDDFEGYLSQIQHQIKVSMMQIEHGIISMEWLEKMLKNMPKPKKK